MEWIKLTEDTYVPIYYYFFFFFRIGGKFLMRKWILRSSLRHLTVYINQEGY